MAFRSKPALAAAGAASSTLTPPVTGAAVAAVKGKVPTVLKESNKGLRGTRRRLSVVSDNKLIEGLFFRFDIIADLTEKRPFPCDVPSMSCLLGAGIATLGVGEEEKVEAEHKVEHIIKTYAGVSKKVSDARTPVHAEFWLLVGFMLNENSLLRRICVRSDDDRLR